MKRIDGEVTRATVHAVTREWATDPASVVEVEHPSFNSDPIAGGYAFACDRGLVTYGFDGYSSWSVDPGSDGDRLAAVDDYWQKALHRHRELRLQDVSVWHRAAIAAAVGAATSVADLPAELRSGVTDFAVADSILVMLRRHTAERTEAALLGALAANDWLLEVPDERSKAHPCPVCNRPAIGRAWKYLCVCDECYSKAVCTDGQLVFGLNTSISGGFEAKHRSDGTICDQVTRDGQVTIDGHTCRMGEARFGGVFVGSAPPL